MLRATCPKVFKLTFLRSNMTPTFISSTKPSLTDEQRDLQLETSQLPDERRFWTLFNKSPLTSYRIESHTLQLQPNLFKA